MESATCATCGAAVVAAEADLTADGLRCRRCTLGAEVQGHVAAVAAAAEARRDAELRRRTARVAQAHAIIWLASAIIFCGMKAQELWLWPLAAAVLIPVGGLLLRQRWAWRIMLGVDVAAAIALVACTPFVDSGARIAPLFVALIPSLLAVGLIVDLRTKRRQA